MYAKKAVPLRRKLRECALARGKQIRETVTEQKGNNNRIEGELG